MKPRVSEITTSQKEAPSRTGMLRGEHGFATPGSSELAHRDGGQTAPKSFNELSAQQQQAHRAKIGVRADAILRQFWRDDDTPDAIRAIELEGWMDVLESCSHSEIRKAWASYQRSGPRTAAGKLCKPDAGAIYKLVIADRPRPKPARQYVEMPRAPRVTKEQAQAIVDAAGYSPKRFGGRSND